MAADTPSLAMRLLWQHPNARGLVAGPANVATINASEAATMTTKKETETKKEEVLWKPLEPFSVLPKHETQPIQTLWSETLAVAMTDLEGRLTPEIDRRNPNAVFICQYCLQPAKGFCFGYPVNMSAHAKESSEKKDNKEIKIIHHWLTKGTGYGSISCMNRDREERRYSWKHETGSYVANMLTRAYGLKDLKALEDVPVAESKVRLPPFDPEQNALWQQGKIEFDGILYHQNHMKGLHLSPPDDTHIFQSDITTCVVEQQQFLSSSALIRKGLTVANLKTMLPDWYIQAD
jgi:hypothetical protein